MIRNLNLDKQFAVSKNTKQPFQPKKKEEPKTAHIYLNSQDKMSGTTREATFKINLPCFFKTNKLNVSLQNFILNYPTNTAGGIIAVNMAGLDAPHTYSSANQNTHRIIGVFAIDEGRVQEYPPVAMTADTTTITGQAYGNGTYVASITSTAGGIGATAFDKIYNGANVRTAFNGGYNFNTGVYQLTTFSTIMSGVDYFGEHLTLQMPSPIVLVRYDYTSHSEWEYRAGTSWVVGGSMDGTNWTLLDTRSGVNWSGANETQSYSIPTNRLAFRYYRLLATRVGNSNRNAYRNGWGIAELRLWGYSDQLLQPRRGGQVKLNSEILTTDKSLFNRPITLCLTSPTGLDLKNLEDWSAEIVVSETDE
jgi:hypothetical protein